MLIHSRPEDREYCRRVQAWLHANGITDFIPQDEPIRVTCGTITYKSMCPAGRTDLIKTEGDHIITTTKTARLTVAVPEEFKCQTFPNHPSA